MLRRIVAACATAALAMLPSAAWAHGDTEAGPTTQLEIGWLNEPAYAGFPNAVFVRAEHDGEPRSDAKLTVVVIYGDENADTRTDPMPLDPAFGRPGEYHANLIPTSAGQYTFKISGRVGEDRVNVTMTSGPKTFAAIEEPTEAQFPEQVPGGIEQRDAIEAVQAAAEDARSAADAADDAAASAKTMGTTGLAVGVLGVLFGVAGLASGRRRAPARPS